jgi:rhamnogalacturonyl hydrolase YesR
MKKIVFICLFMNGIFNLFPKENRIPTTHSEVIALIKKVNDYWQNTHPQPGNSFWNHAAYHIGNLAAYEVTQEERYRRFSEDWAEHNQWKGAQSDKPEEWLYEYGETCRHVLFGDWQICFQVYADLYRMAPENKKIARAKEVIEYEMATPNNDYWWWADGLYMVMPVMTKLYKITNNKLYLNKLYEYFHYADSVMYDSRENLYYRDERYVYPNHQTANGKKDFWARGDGWVFAAFARVLQDLPKDDSHYELYLQRYKALAKALNPLQQTDGYWTRSLLDADFAPGYETSGTAFFTFAYLWGINNGFLNEEEYLPVVEKAWKYLTTIALHADGKLGFIQPIGDRAVPGQKIDGNSTADFGVGAFLLAASEMAKYIFKI